MRADMAKVIVERPRKKSCAWEKPKGYQRRLRRYGDDGPPAREGIQACWRGRTKYLNEHLGPLRRYLDKQVGRPWDKVFSEICAHIDRSNAVQDHVRDHVEDYVTTHVLLIDGVPCNGEGGWNYGKPLHQIGYRPWYVCPGTGLLRRVKVPSRRRSSRPPRKSPPPFVPVSDTLQCRFLDGAWHLVTLKPLPSPFYDRGRCTAVDVLLNLRADRLTPADARRHYGAGVYAVAPPQAGLERTASLPHPRTLVEWVVTGERVEFVGLQGSGKSSLFRARFVNTHDWVSKDCFPTDRNSTGRQRHFVEEALGAGRPVAVGHTNSTVRTRGIDRPRPRIRGSGGPLLLRVPANRLPGA